MAPWEAEEHALIVHDQALAGRERASELGWYPSVGLPLRLACYMGCSSIDAGEQAFAIFRQDRDAVAQPECAARTACVEACHVQRVGERAADEAIETFGGHFAFLARAGAELHYVRVDGQSQLIARLEAKRAFADIRFSPDGKQVAYEEVRDTTNDPDPYASLVAAQIKDVHLVRLGDAESPLEHFLVRWPVAQSSRAHRPSRP